MDRGRVHGARRVRSDVLVLAAILAVAAFARLLGLGLMEFKADEAEASTLALHVLGYSEPGVGRYFPTAGLTASVGVPYPALFEYLIALPLAMVRSPYAATAFIAATNVVAVWLCYLIGKRYFSRFVGIASAALFAISPWGIVFSRKIWAPDMLPLFSGLFLLVLHAFLVEKRRSAAFWMIVLVAAATQLHFSALILLPILVAGLVLGRDAIDWRWISLGLATAIALWTPFLAYHGVDAFHAATNAAGDNGMNAAGRFEGAGRFMLAIAGGDKLSLFLGSQPALARPLSLVLGPAALGGLLLGFRKWRTAGGLGRARALLAVWYVLPLTVLTVFPTPPFIHYFVILFPLPFLGLAVIAERLVRRRALAGWVTLAACLASFAYLDARFFQTIVHHGGGIGEYGIGYEYKARAVAMMVRDNPGRQVEIGTDADFDPGRGALEYRFMVWNTDPGAPERVGPPKTGYVVFDTALGTPPILKASPHERSYARAHFGPLEVVSIPLSR